VKIPPLSIKAGVQSFELKAKSFEIAVQSFEFRAKSFEIAAQGFELRAKSFEIAVQSFEFRAKSFKTGALRCKITPLNRYFKNPPPYYDIINLLTLL